MLRLPPGLDGLRTAHVLRGPLRLRLGLGGRRPGQLRHRRRPGPRRRVPAGRLLPHAGGPLVDPRVEGGVEVHVPVAIRFGNHGMLELVGQGGDVRRRVPGVPERPGTLEVVGLRIPRLQPRFPIIFNLLGEGGWLRARLVVFVVRGFLSILSLIYVLMFYVLMFSGLKTRLKTRLKTVFLLVFGVISGVSVLSILLVFLDLFF